MRGIAAHEDETLRRRPRQPAHVADRVPWRVDEVETAVSEIVVGVEAADLEVRAFFGNVDFSDLAALKVVLQEWGLLVHGEARQVRFFEAWADYELCA